MMLKSVTFVLLIVCVLNAFGSFYSVPAGHPDHPGKCWFPEKEVEMEVGDKITSTFYHCVEYTCVKNDDGIDFSFIDNNQTADFYFSQIGCAEFRTNCGYRIQEGDPKKPYPDCCPTTVRDKSQTCYTSPD